MPRIKVDGTKSHPRSCFPKELIREGFVGDMQILNDAMTATIIHPEANLDEVKKSLRLILRGIDLRIARAKKKDK